MAPKENQIEIGQAAEPQPQPQPQPFAKYKTFSPSSFYKVLSPLNDIEKPGTLIILT